MDAKEENKSIELFADLERRYPYLMGCLAESHRIYIKVARDYENAEPNTPLSKYLKDLFDVTYAQHKEYLTQLGRNIWMDATKHWNR